MITRQEAHMIKKLKDIARELSILYVDDNKELCKTNLSFFNDIFKEADYALNGYDAIKLYKKNSYDLVITDINMPRLNGFLLIKKIKKINPHQTVIIVSAYSEIEHLSKINHCNIDYFLTKPVDTKELIAKIYECISTEEVRE